MKFSPLLVMPPIALFALFTMGCGGRSGGAPDLHVYTPGTTDPLILSLPHNAQDKDEMIRATIDKHLGNAPLARTPSIGLFRDRHPGGHSATAQYYVTNSADQGYTLMRAHLLDNPPGSWTNQTLAGPTQEYDYLLRITADRVIEDLALHRERR